VISNGTDNHSMLVDLRSRFPELTGKMAENVLVKADITTNKNTVPDDPQGPFVTSGIRIGTPAVTTRGFNEGDMAKVAEAIALVVDNPGDPDKAAKAKAIVKELCEAHPLYK